MNTLEAIRARRAVKHYDPNFQIPEKDIAELKDLIRQTPSSFNIQNWRILSIEDPELRKKVRAVAWDQAQVTDASHVFLVCGDLKAWDQDPARYWETAPQEAQDFLIPAIKNFYEGREWQQRDEVMRSAGLAGQTLMVAAKAMGYESCPMIGFDPDALAELIKLPENYLIGMMIAVGKGVEPARPKGGYIPDEEVFFTDTF